MILFLIISTMVVLGQSVSAQSLLVRSGEHEDFTRFVIRIQPGTEWSLDTGPRQAELSIVLPQVRFDTSGIFRRIPRKRVEDVVQTEPGGPLGFRLGCDCRVDAFVEQGNLLVVDVKDERQSPLRLPLTIPPTTEYRFVLGRSYRRVFALPPDEGGAQVATATSESVVLPLVPDRAILSKGRVTNAWPAIAERESDVGAQEDRLLEQIRRALDQGLLDGDVPEADPDGKVIEKPKQNIDNIELPTGLSGSNVSVSTAVDRDLARIEEALRANAPPHSKCLPQSSIALQDWGDERPFATQISELRQTLVEDLVDVNPNGVVRLAQTYLYFGFGAEARHVLSTAQVPLQQEGVLLALASLIDGRELQGDNPFAGQHACDGDVALWAVYADPTGMSEVNKPALLRAVARLPLPLREHIAPSLSRLFSEATDVATAEAILRTIERATETANQATILARASTQDLRGNFDGANEARAAVASESSELSPEALVDLINSRFELGETVTPDVLDLVGAYAEQFQRSELGLPLREAEVTALAMVGRFDDSIARLDAMTGREDDGSHKELSLKILRALTGTSSDMDFLRHALNLSEGWAADIPEDLGNDMAERYLALGFSQPAIRLLSEPQSEGSSERRRLLKAQAALMETLPHEAMVALLGLEGDKADRLRAAAMAQRQDYARAAAILSQANDREVPPRVRWLAEDWQQPVIAEDDYSVASGIAFELRQSTEALSQSETLENARALLDDSSRTRSDIDALLTRLDVAAEPGR